MRKYLGVIIGLLLLAGGEATAYINPSLQPMKLGSRYEAVIGTVVEERDVDAGTMQLKVTEVYSGEFAAETISVSTVEATRDEPIFLDDGHRIVAFVSAKRRPDEVLFYTGGGVWQEAEIVEDEHTRWKWTVVHDEQTVGSLFGTYNGNHGRFLEMMADLREGAYYFPPRPFQQFSQTVLGEFDEPLRGVALYDVDGDGDVDAYGCSAAGNRLYLQEGPMKFTDATAKLGLDGISGASCSFSDADADGRADLLADGAIYAQAEDGTFEKTDWLPAEADEEVKSSAFVEINGDGYPDVIVSKVGGGLHAYLNPGKGGEAFEDATEALGLTKAAAVAGGTGFFSTGDWNGDGRMDVYYGSPPAMLLTQTEEGTFAPMRLGIDLAAFGEGPGMTGAGAIAPLWSNTAMSVIVPSDASFTLLAEVEGRLVNVITDTNELENEPAESQISVLCEDLDADGYVDIYTGTRSGGCNYHCNRGYGSFMRANKYAPGSFPEAFRTGAWGLAAGDVNDDGANDVLLGGVDGRLVILVNETLSLRSADVEVNHHGKKRYQTTILAVTVSGPVGVTGAKMELFDAEDRPVAIRTIGTNVNVGSHGSDRINLAVREDGEYNLKVTWSDGATREMPLTVGEERRMPVTVERPSAAAGCGG